MNKLEIKDLHVAVEGKEILKGVNLIINQGEIHAIMGPNGSGKSTLSNAIMGSPKYDVTKGEILFNGKNVLEMKPNERAKLGLFMSFQYPFEIAGLPFSTFMLAAYRNHFPGTKISALELRKLMQEKLKVLGLDDDFIKRELNVGFSGGEKKRAEILQMLVLNPKMAILDETDSGLDIDSLKLVSMAVNTMRSPNFSALIITHYKRILNYVKPDFVHVFVNGKIVMSGDSKLADELELKGYAWVTEDTPNPTQTAMGEE
ncbi:MAG: Fe-S cluster assembly ATPase SufC [archaeon]|nr:Fe-S cluster assembly ATPase SufC [archaeon]